MCPMEGFYYTQSLTFSLQTVIECTVCIQQLHAVAVVAEAEREAFIDKINVRFYQDTQLEAQPLYPI